jgi:hypothetical protein
MSSRIERAAVHRSSILCGTACLAMFFAAPALAQTNTKLIALSGQASPDGNGNFSSFDSVAINDAGQVLFTAALVNTSGAFSDNEGVFRGDGVANVQIARKGQLAPDLNGRYGFFNSVALNDAGEALFWAFLSDTGSGLNDAGIFRGDGTGITQLAREGQAAPGGSGTFTGLSFDPAFNNAGQAAFVGDVRLDTNPTIPIGGVFQTIGSNLISVVRRGDAGPNGSGHFTGASSPVLNNAGQVAFYGGVDNVPGPFPNAYSGIFRRDAAAVAQIARTGQPAPDSNGAFFIFGEQLLLNESGQVAFLARLTGTQGGFSDDHGIFRSDGGQLKQIARAGQLAPGGNGSFAVLGLFVLNDLGHVAFTSSLTGTAGGASDDFGLYRGDGETLAQIVRKGDPIPNDGATFNGIGFGSLASNAAGQTAFLAELSGTSDDANAGIFLHDDQLGLVEIVRKGDDLFGSTIIAIEFTGHRWPLADDERGGLNSLGQVAYRFTLADGRTGIAVASLVPEPARQALLIASAACALLRFRSCRHQP